MESKTIPGYEQLVVYSNGTVYDLRKNKFLKAYKNTDGYYMVKVYIGKQGGKYKTLMPRIHRLLALAFIPNPENKPEVNHINGIKTDNRIENLEWATRVENIRHGWRLGLYNPKREKGIFIKKS